MARQKEGVFKDSVLRDIQRRYPNAQITKQDPTYFQGIPDVVIFNEDKWAMLEFKRSSKASFQPNQEYYLDKFNKMSFARAIYPENREEVLNELYETFGA